MVLRRIFGPRRDEITGEWRRLHNEELNDLYSAVYENSFEVQWKALKKGRSWETWK